MPRDMAMLGGDNPPGHPAALAAAPFVSQDIDAFLVRAWERSYETMLHFGRRGLNLAATASIQAATKVPREVTALGDIP